MAQTTLNNGDTGLVFRTGLNNMFTELYGWGNHASAGYLTTVTAANIDAGASLDGYVLTSDGAGNVAWEAVPVGGGGISNLVEDTTPQLGGTLDANGNIIDMGVNTITDTKVGNWDTAFGWGDHSGQGYLTTVAINDVSDITITTPADNEVLAYNGAGSWINQTAAEAGLATAAQGTLADSALQSSDIGVSVQAYDADLASWAGVTRASGFDTFTATPSSANLASLVTDETGSGALVFGTGPAITAPTITGTIIEDVYTVTGTTPALEPANGSIQVWTLTANSTPTDSLVAGEAITLMIDDGTAYTITWPTMTWVNNAGSAPTLATTGYTVVALWKVSTTLYGALVGDGT